LFSLLHDLRDDFDDGVRFVQHLVVPEPKHPEPERFKVIIPTGIESAPLQVLATIHLDNETFFQAYEIDDVEANGPLAAELVAMDLA